MNKRTISNCICDQTVYANGDRCVCDGASYNCYACYAGANSCMCYTTNYDKGYCSCDAKMYKGNCVNYNGTVSYYKGIGTVTADKLNVRERPDRLSLSVATLTSGQVVEIVDKSNSNDGVWYLIKPVGTMKDKGYISANYVNARMVEETQDHNSGAGGANTPEQPSFVDERKYIIPDLDFYGNRNSVAYLDIINLMEEIDLHVAKFESTSDNGYWCFHGHEKLGWESKDSELKDRRMIFKNSIYRDLGWTKENMLKHKHLTIRMQTYELIKGIVTYGIKVKFELRDSKNALISVDTIQRVDSLSRNTTIYFDIEPLLKDIAFNTVERITIVPLYYNMGSDIPNNAINKFSLEYIKLDNQDRQYYPYFTGLIDNRELPSSDENSRLRKGKTVTDDDIDIAREETKIARRFEIQWLDDGNSKKDLARAFIDTVKKQSLVEVNKYVKETDNCSKCDSYTCPCYATAYGFVACKTCDGCNSYTACSCDVKCHSETWNCSCHQKCDNYNHTCGCYNKCDGYNSCACHQKCFNEGTTCTCDYKQNLTCTCNHTCHAHSWTGCSCDNRCHEYNRCSCDGDWR